MIHTIKNARKVELIYVLGLVIFNGTDNMNDQIHVISAGAILTSHLSQPNKQEPPFFDKDRAQGGINVSRVR